MCGSSPAEEERDGPLLRAENHISKIQLTDEQNLYFEQIFAEAQSTFETTCQVECRAHLIVPDPARATDEKLVPSMPSGLLPASVGGSTTMTTRRRL